MNEAHILVRTPASRAMALLPSTVVAVLAVMTIGFVGHEVSGAPSTSAPPSPVVAERSLAGQADETPIVLQLPHGTATAVLADTPAAHQLGAMLPVRLSLHDRMGQAKSGLLPTPLQTTRAERTLDPEVGGIYYWPPSGDLAVFYDDLGQTVPPPGLVRIGTITGGLPAVADAGRGCDVSLIPG
jgi:hypothetical protein